MVKAEAEAPTSEIANEKAAIIDFNGNTVTPEES
jgi:hypothetical protein